MIVTLAEEVESIVVYFLKNAPKHIKEASQDIIDEHQSATHKEEFLISSTNFPLNMLVCFSVTTFQ